MSVTQAEMDKYFETQGKEAPAALIEAEKVEAETPQEAPIEKTEPKIETKVETKVEKPEGEVQVQVEGKTVPLSELIEERKRRQAWESTAAQQQQQLTETLKMLQDRAKSLPQNEQEQAPDVNSDPWGYQQYVLQKLGSSVQEISQWRQQQEQQNQAQQNANRMMAWASQKTNEFAATTPDFGDAYKFAREDKIKELQAFGLDQPTIDKELERSQANIIAYAAQSGKNPAQLVYDYAKARGFKAEIVAKPVPDLNEKVKTINRGQEASKGLSKTSGGAPTEISNLQDLAAASEDMSDEEFSKAFDKIAPKMKGKYV